MPRKTSLRTRIILYVSVVVLVFLVGALVWALQTTRRTLYQQMESRATALADEIGYTFEVLATNGDTISLNRVVEETGTIAEVKEVGVSDRAGHYIAHNRPEQIGQPSAYPFVVPSIASEQRRVEYAPDEFVVVQPLHGTTYSIANHTDVIGAIIIVMDLTPVNANLRAAVLAAALAMTLSIILVGIGLVLIMNRLVINPIMALSAATRQLADGQWRPTFRTSLPGEIGDLARSFDLMARALAEREQLLQTQRDDLRDANAALRTSDERFHLVARATNDAIWDYDLVTQAVWWNDSVQSMFGYRAETIAPSFACWLTRLHPDDQERVNASFAAALAKGEQFWADEYRFRRSDGSYADIFDRTYVLYDAHQQPVRAIGSMMDMTARKQVERMKDEFIATISHELRTPLTSIRGALGLIAGGVAGELPTQMRMMVEIAHKNSERLMLLINDILDIEKIASGTLVFDLRPQALTPLVEQAIEANRAYGAQFGVTFALEQTLPGSMVNVDGARLLQVFANLLSNAAKFSPPGDTVSISMARGNRAIRVAVRDHGPGIPAAFQARMFQKFAQADSSDTRQKGGTGLGLSIAKAIVEKLGGQIGFETASNVGTTFSIDLPEWHEAAAPQTMDA